MSSHQMGAIMAVAAFAASSEAAFDCRETQILKDGAKCDSILEESCGATTCCTDASTCDDYTCGPGYEKSEPDESTSYSYSDCCEKIAGSCLKLDDTENCGTLTYLNSNTWADVVTDGGTFQAECCMAISKCENFMTLSVLPTKSGFVYDPSKAAAAAETDDELIANCMSENAVCSDYTCPSSNMVSKGNDDFVCAGLVCSAGECCNWKEGSCLADSKQCTDQSKAVGTKSYDTSEGDTQDSFDVQCCEAKFECANANPGSAQIDGARPAAFGASAAVGAALLSAAIGAAV